MGPERFRAFAPSAAAPTCSGWAASPTVCWVRIIPVAGRSCSGRGVQAARRGPPRPGRAARIQPSRTARAPTRRTVIERGAGRRSQVSARISTSRCVSPGNTECTAPRSVRQGVGSRDALAFMSVVQAQAVFCICRRCPTSSAPAERQTRFHRRVKTSCATPDLDVPSCWR